MFFKITSCSCTYFSRLKIRCRGKIIKNDFLRAPRIGRHSRKIDFSFISPKHSYGWTCSRKNSSKFQRFLLRPKFKKVWNLHPMAVFASWNVQNFTLLYENSVGVKRILENKTWLKHHFILILENREINFLKFCL